MTSVDDREELLDGAEHEELGVRLGLALVAALGGLLGTTTSGGLWLCYPLPRGEHWPVPVIALTSLLLLAVGYVVLRRRVGAVVADWFAVGYVIPLIGFGTLLVGGEAVRFVHERVEAALTN